MKLILRFFPVNKGIQKGNILSLFLTILKYMAIWMIAFLVAQSRRRFPLTGNLYYHTYKLLGIYCLLGIIFTLFQYFMMGSDTEICYITRDEVSKIFAPKAVPVIVLIVAGILCLVPQNIWNINGKDAHSKGKVAERTEEEITVAESQKQQEQVEEEATAEAVPEEMKLFYEQAKGAWTAKEGMCTFCRFENQYYFLSTVLGEKYPYRPMKYQVTAFEDRNGEITATFEEGYVSTHTYTATFSQDETGHRQMRLTKEGEGEVLLTDNTLHSYEELWDKDAYEMLYLGANSSEGHIFYGDDIEKYAYLDLTDVYEGEELITKKPFGKKEAKICILAQADGYVLPLVDDYSYGEYYDKTNREFFWFWKYEKINHEMLEGYREIAFDQEKERWRTNDVQINTDDCEVAVFARVGTAYADARVEYERELAEAAAEQARLEQEKAEKTIPNDETMIITEPLDTYVGSYGKGEEMIVIDQVSEDSIKISYPSGDYENRGSGKRIIDRYIDGMMVYRVDGYVASNVTNIDYYGRTSHKNFAYSIVIALKPDGNIILNNRSSSDFKFQEGVYSR